MADNFAFNAPQFVDFTNDLQVEDEEIVESYFGKYCVNVYIFIIINL